jgi:hypothetical protein
MVNVKPHGPRAQYAGHPCSDLLKRSIYGTFTKMAASLVASGGARGSCGLIRTQP